MNEMKFGVANMAYGIFFTRSLSPLLLHSSVYFYIYD
jgi:hypothetical protein